MKTKIARAACAALLLGSLSGTAFAAEDLNPFDDVPKDHWAYAEVQQLAKDGLITGYKDGTFRGEEVLTRYEMAAIVGRAVEKLRQGEGTDADYAAIEKLQKEFGYELKSMGVRLARLEKYKSNVGFYGDVRMRYIKGAHNQNVRGDGKRGEKGLEQRTRLGYYSEIAPGFTFNARLRADHKIGESTPDSVDGDMKYDSTGKVKIDLAQFTWQHKRLALSGGRMNPELGQGTLWSKNGDDAMDGFLLGYAPTRNLRLRAGWASIGQLADEYYYQDTLHAADTDLRDKVQDKIAGSYAPAFLGDIKWQLGSTELSLAYLKTLSEAEKIRLFGRASTVDPWYETAANFRLHQIALGFHTELTPRLSLKGEWVHNNSASGQRPGDKLYFTGWPIPKGVQKTAVRDQKYGGWLSLAYGNLNEKKAHSYKLSLMYLHLGNWAINSTLWAHGLPVRGGDGMGMDGEKGWGIGAAYMLAPNVRLSGSYFWLKPYDEAASGFSRYQNPWQIALDYQF